jgi:hypothetical protein
MTGADKFNSVLNSVTHIAIQLSPVDRVLCSGGLNHVNSHILPAQTYESISPSNNEVNWTALIAVFMKMSKKNYSQPGAPV